MTINELVTMAQRIHDAESWDLGARSTRDQRNAFWARVIGCAHHGHPSYNRSPDARWHLKRADAGRPQSDDVAVMMPSRDFWDCIVAAGQDNYQFKPHYEGILPADQIVFAPPVPDGAGPQPVPPPPPAPEPPRLSYGELLGLISALHVQYGPHVVHPEVVAHWSWRLLVENYTVDDIRQDAAERAEWGQ